MTYDLVNRLSMSIREVLYLSTPFVALICLTASLARRTDGRYAAVFFALFLTALVVIYVHGITVYSARISDKMWTAAAAALGFLPIKCIPVVAGAWLVKIWLVSAKSADDAG